MQNFALLFAFCCCLCCPFISRVWRQCFTVHLNLTNSTYWVSAVESSRLTFWALDKSAHLTIRFSFCIFYPILYLSGVSICQMCSSIENIPIVGNCPDVAILNSLFGLCLLSICLFFFFLFFFFLFFFSIKKNILRNTNKRQKTKI